MTSELLDALKEMKEAEERKKGKKKKPVFELRKEKRLMYYSGWHKDDKPVTEESER